MYKIITLGKILYQRKKGIIFSTILLILFAIIGFLYQSARTPFQIHKTNILFINIFLHNILCILLIIIAGIFTLGLASIGIIIFYGMYFGVIIGSIAKGSGIKLVLTSIVPHGIFEIAAFIISIIISYSSFRLVLVILVSKMKKKKISIKKYLLNDIKEVGYLFSTVAVLLFIASIIESTFSTSFIK